MRRLYLDVTFRHRATSLGLLLLPLVGPERGESTPGIRSIKLVDFSRAQSQQVKSDPAAPIRRKPTVVQSLVSGPRIPSIQAFKRTREKHAAVNREPRLTLCVRNERAAATYQEK
jgi:hypothetical protein